MDSILFIVRSYTKGGAQPLRFRKITELLKNKYDIHVLELNNKEEIIFQSGITIHRIGYSKIGSLLNPGSQNSVKIQNSNKSKKKPQKTFSYLKQLIRRFIFPDTLLFEKKKLGEKSIKIIKDNQINIVIGSAFPFTILKLSKYIKREINSIRFIYDIGDPFFGNAKNTRFKDWLANKYEKAYLPYIDHLVVTNQLTKDHYLYSYSNILNERQISIIEQGVDSIYLNKLAIISNEKEMISKKTIELIYAGQFYKKLREPYELFKAIDNWNISKNRFLKLSLYGSFSEIFKNTKSKNIVFKGSFSNDQILGLYLKADIIVFLDNAYGMQTPGKIFELAPINKPILFISDHENSPAYEVVKDNDNIFKCMNESKSIETALKQFFLHRNSFQIKDSKKYSWERKSFQYKTIITNHRNAIIKPTI